MLRLCRHATAVLVFTTLFPTLAVAQTSRAGIVTTLEGTVTARRVAAPQPVALKFKDDVFMQDRIVTGEKSLARLLLGDKAIVTVRERSIFTVSESPGRSTVEVDSGKIGLAVAKERMRPGEQIEIRTPGAIVAVRGTVVVIDVPDANATGGAALPAAAVRPGAGQAVAQAAGTPPAESVFVLRGAVEARVRTSPSGPLGPPVMVNAFQVLTVRGGVGTVNAFTPQQVSAIVSGLRASAPQFKDGANAEETKATARQTTAALVQALVGTGPGGANGARPAGPDPKDGPRPDQSPMGPLAPPLIPDFTTEDIANVSGELQVSGFRFLPPGARLATFSGTSNRDSTAPFVNVLQADLIQGGADDLISVAPGAVASLAGPLARVRGSNVLTGGHFLDVSGTIVGTGSESFLSFNPSTIFSPSSLIRVGPSGRLSVASPLLSDVGSTFVVGGDFLSVAGELTSLSPLAALHLVDSTVLAGAAGGGGGVPGGGSFFSLSGSSARATLAGPAFAAVGGSFTFIGSSVVRIDGGANLVGTSAAPFFLLDNVATSIDTSQAGLLFANSSTSLAGGLLDMHNVLDLGGTGSAAPLVVVVGASLSTGQTLVNLGDTDLDMSNSYLLAMANASTVTVGGALVSLFNSRLDTLELLAIDPTSTLTLSGPIAALGNSTLTSVMDLVPVKNGARIISASAGPFLALNGSTLAVGDAILGLRGRAGQTAMEVANGVSLTLGTDQPITHSSLWIDAVNSTVTTKHAVALDTALLDASAPLLSLRAGSVMTTSLDAVHLASQAKLTTIGPLVALDAGQLTVASGAVLNIANGSLVRINGDLFALANGSLLRTNNGPLVRVSGNSVLNVTGAFIAFGGSGANQVTVSNSLCGTSCVTAAGIPLHFINGASLSNVTIGANPIKNTGLGSFAPMGPAAAAILLDGTNSKVNIVAP